MHIKYNNAIKERPAPELRARFALKYIYMHNLKYSH